MLRGGEGKALRQADTESRAAVYVCMNMSAHLETHLASFDLDTVLPHAGARR